MKKDSVIYTSELIENFSKENNHDEGLIRDIYYFYMDKVRKKAAEEDNVEIPIKNFGTLYLTLTGAQSEINNAKKVKSKKFKENADQRARRYEAKRKKVQEKIAILKENKINRIPFFNRIFQHTNIKNV